MSVGRVVDVRPGPKGIPLAALFFATLLLAQHPARYPSPDDMALSPDGKRLYVVCGGTDELVVVDRLAKAITARIPVGRVPRGVAVSGSRIYVTNSWSDTVSEIDAATLRVIRTLPAGFEPTGVAVGPQGNSLYIANRLGNDVAAVSFAFLSTLSIRTQLQSLIVLRPGLKPRAQSPEARLKPARRCSHQPDSSGFLLFSQGLRPPGGAPGDSQICFLGKTPERENRQQSRQEGCIGQSTPHAGLKSQDERTASLCMARTHPGAL